MFFMFHIIVDYTTHKNILNAAFAYVFEPFETLFSFFNAYLLYFLDIFFRLDTCWDIDNV